LLLKETDGYQNVENTLIEVSGEAVIETK